jgi:hypothetical protein
VPDDGFLDGNEIDRGEAGLAQRPDEPRFRRAAEGRVDDAGDGRVIGRLAVAKSARAQVPAMIWVNNFISTSGQVMCGLWLASIS